MQWKARRLPREEGTGETPQAKAEEAPGSPAGKRSAWNGNQPSYNSPLQTQKNTPHKKGVLNITFYI
ncbi:hypothetical protein FZC74_19790 [Sutcliffiella horikoshii]|uniref:Uncharacterized protein n=1 Tax=Sutcliffiella horikoshii TaxID=79883 RepID=A0AA94WMI4_9BACI|nr:hypothetical protein FZC74_19790 [Sutcliffiella horikoshii]